jgi:p-aminobenzoyl-glutamate transporter AbgT
MRKNIFYVIYNLIYQLASFFFFLYANTYVNEAFVPQSLMWKDNKARTDSSGLGGVAAIKTLALVTEAVVLILLIYFVNRLILSDTEGKDRRNAIASRTAKINVIISLCFIVILIWGSFRGYLW